MLNFNKYLISREKTNKRLLKMRKRKRILDWKISKFQSESELLQSEINKVGQTGSTRKDRRFVLWINFKLKKIKTGSKFLANYRQKKCRCNYRTCFKDNMFQCIILPSPHSNQNLKSVFLFRHAQARNMCRAHIQTLLGVDKPNLWID